MPRLLWHAYAKPDSKNWKEDTSDTGLLYVTILMNVTERFATGLLPIKMPYDEVSERHFDVYRYSRSTAPASYNAVTAGLVTSVKSQGTCGSCAAFATMATVETCFAKQLGKLIHHFNELFGHPL